MSNRVLPYKWSSPLLDLDRDYKILYGGRGSGKSYAMHLSALSRAWEKRQLVLCLREIQKSLEASSMMLLKNIIDSNDIFRNFYEVRSDRIIGRNGSMFIFRGASGSRGTLEQIKSLEGLNLVLIEEAQDITRDTANVLFPTFFRQDDSEVWACLNPTREFDPLYELATSGDDNVWSLKVNYDMNTRHFSDKMERLRLQDLKERPNHYPHIWEGELQEEGLDDSPVVTMGLLRDCFDSYLSKYEVGPVTGGFDVADRGADMNALCIRKGPVVIHMERWSGKGRTLGRSTRKVHNLCREYGVTKLFYDATGIGGSVYSEFKQIVPDYDFIGIDFGGKVEGKKRLYTKGITNEENFMNRSSQLSWAFKLRANRTRRLMNGEGGVRPGDCVFFSTDLRHKKLMRQELSRPTWDNEKSKKIKITKRVKGAPSPDMYDSVVLAFAQDSQHGLSEGTHRIGWADIARIAEKC